jgi:hypothetical protein
VPIKDAHPGFTLAQLIQSTADELRKVKADKSADAVMQFTGCELELAVTIGTEGGGGIKFWLVDLSAKASAESVSRVKLSFGPIPGTSIAAAAISGGDKGPKATRSSGKATS